MAAPLRFQHFQVLTRDDGTPWQLGRIPGGGTWCGEDTQYNARVLIRQLPFVQGPQKDEVQLNFATEMGMAALLHHPNIAQVQDFFEEPAGQAFVYVREFCDGPSLAEVVATQGPLDALTALDHLRQIALGLLTADKRGMQPHRALHPGQIFRVEEDYTTVLKVTDYGLGAPLPFVHAEQWLSLSAQCYAGPEVLRGKTADARSDLFSLGALLWFLLKGKGPFPDGNPQRRESPPWQDLWDVPTAVIKIIHRLLRVNPADRYEHASALIKEISDLMWHIMQQGAHNLPTGLSGLEDFNPNPPAFADTGTAPEFFSEVTPSADRGEVRAVAPRVDPSLRYTYTPADLVREDESGKLFRGRDTVEDLPVLVRELHHLLFYAPGLVSQLEQKVKVLKGMVHGNLVRYDAVVRTAQQFRIIAEWNDGLNLLSLLRERNRLRFEEAYDILKQLAAAIDALQKAGLEDFEHDPFHILLTSTLPGDVLAPDDFTGAWQQWPPFILKIDPLKLPRTGGGGGGGDGDGSNMTMSGGMTMAGGTMTPNGSSRPGQTLLQHYAGLMYQMLGGNPEILAGKQRYRTLAELSERANMILESALQNLGSKTCEKLLDTVTKAQGGRK